VASMIGGEWNDQDCESVVGGVSEISRAAMGKCLFQSSKQY